MKLKMMTPKDTRSLLTMISDKKIYQEKLQNICYAMLCEKYNEYSLNFKKSFFKRSPYSLDKFINNLVHTSGSDYYLKLEHETKTIKGNIPSYLNYISNNNIQKSGRLTQREYAMLDFLQIAIIIM